MRRSDALPLLALAAFTLAGPAATLAEPASWVQMRQADWMGDALRGVSDPLAAVRPKTAEDASGGCDGVKTGQWGFHTENQAGPWWQVDLGQARPLSHLRIWNRCDGTAGRASRLMVLVSPDGAGWERVYGHNGQTFYGQSDQKPLEVPLGNRQARFVRLQLPGTSYFHLDEVEVFAGGEPGKNIALDCPADQSSMSQLSLIHI